MMAEAAGQWSRIKCWPVESPETAGSFIMTPSVVSFIMQAHASGSATGRMSDEMLISRQEKPTPEDLILMESHKCLCASPTCKMVLWLWQMP